MAVYVFYDLETSGTSPAFDQPLQFAGILTNDELEEIERIEFRCRLSPHILPAPWALAVTGVTPDMLVDPSLPSAFEFAQEISNLIRQWGPATWVGYNSVAFDEQMLRQMFFQNLHPNPYLTQADGNYRLDIMKLVYATWIMANDALKWPTDDAGKVSFKLDQLAPANGFVSENFHDAVSDVEATIYIAQLIRKRAAKVWTQSLKNRSTKNTLHLLESGRVLKLIERYGVAPPRAYLGAFAGRHPDNPNSVAFMDLELVDPNTLDPTDGAAVADAVNASPKRVRTISVNNAPNIFEVSVDDPELFDRAAALRGMHDLHTALGNALADRFADRPEPEEVELQIYSGFFNNDDKAKLNQFQIASWAERIEIALALEDRRLQWLAKRLVYLNKPNLLSRSAQEHWKQIIARRWQSDDPKAEWTTFSRAAQQLSEISQQGVLSENEVGALSAYFEQLSKRMKPS
ncbi:exonuclease domain-containing protein [Roseobacter weihaiensis]|uniref:exonuclease domain-containing protein n=1 Tax=Roseobacter weihaiensis TaxID=2763262 RepID=UPI001D0BDD7A|nr:exonuclease domain-containing protein [Roseobacter sp. H9]